VMELIAVPLPTTVVASRLAISEVTVRRHISSAVRRLGAADRAEAVDMLQRESAAAQISPEGVGGITGNPTDR